MKKKENNTLDRATKWTMHTIQWTYINVNIITTGIFSKKGILKSSEKKRAINNCLKAHLPYKKYLLLYTCYLFGALYGYSKIRKVKFENNQKFLFNQLKNFFRVVEIYYKNPKKSMQHLPFMDTLPGKESVNLNKNIFLAHLPRLKEKHLLNIVCWFMHNWKKNNSIQKVFYAAEHYISLEADGIFKEVSAKVRSNKRYITERAIVKSATGIFPIKFSKFKKSGLVKHVALRLSYEFLTEQYGKKINDCYLNSKYKELEIEPLEVQIRDQIGIVLSTKDISEIGEVAKKLGKSKNDWQTKVAEARSRWVYNIGNSGGVAAKFLMSYIQEKDKI